MLLVLLSMSCSWRPQDLHEVDPEVSQAVKHSLSLMGNFFARLTKERRRKVLLRLHKDLARMADEDFAEVGCTLW